MLELRASRNGPWVPLRFVKVGDSWWVGASSDDARWPSEALRHGEVRVRRQGGPEEVRRASLVSDPDERRRFLSLAVDRFGPQLAREWFAYQRRVIRLDPTEPGVPGPGYAQWLSSEFDVAAETYEARIRSNPLERRARERSLEILCRTFPAGSRLLELGSGPGLETLPLLRAGYGVTAVDAAPRMLARLRAGAQEGGVSDRLQTQVLRLSKLGDLAPGEFDGAFSTFGALNCEPDLAPVVAALRTRLPVGAAVVAGTFQPVAPLETLAFLALGRPGRAFNRLAETVAAEPSSRFTIDWFPRSARAVERAFAPGFHLESAVGLGGLLPPPDFAPRLASAGGLLDVWTKADIRWGSRWPGRWLGDHEILVLRKSG